MARNIDPQARSDEEARRLAEERRRLEEAENGRPDEPVPTRGDPDEDAMREARRRVEGEE
jgi:hypothetical protein